MVDKAKCLLNEYPGDPIFRKGIAYILTTQKGVKKMTRDWWSQVVMRNATKSDELLQHPTSSFEFVAQSSGLNVSAQELERLSENFYLACKTLFSNKSDTRTMLWVRQWLDDWDFTNNWSRWYYNWALKAGLLKQTIQNEASRYFRWIKPPPYVKQ